MHGDVRGLAQLNSNNNSRGTVRELSISINNEKHRKKKKASSWGIV